MEGRLLALATLFMVLYAAALTLSPAVRARSWEAVLRWDHWISLLLWLPAFFIAHRQCTRWLPARDPYLLPIGALLSGWGILTIWRLLPIFGLRQAIWLVIAVGLLILGLRLPNDLDFLRKYKYLWLTGSLLLTALTLVLGTNPLGYGPRMWLGCCGIYLQPSEPLKLMLIAYLAAYFADRQFDLYFSLRIPGRGDKVEKNKTAGLKGVASADLLPLLTPTLIMTGFALALLLIQRDLGTAFIFMFLYAAVVYVTSGRKSVLVVATMILLVTGVMGYLLFDVVRVRVDAWLNPWLDPSGRSYQIVQSLLAIANGGILGRGPGVGNPGVVPVSHSDLIFSAIAEEHGLIGSIALLIIIALLASRGLRASINATDAYRRYLAAGLTAYLVGQSLLIVAGSLRLLPLTGITLNFLSYGGSSLVTSFVALMLLLHVSHPGEHKPAALPSLHPYLHLGGFMFFGVVAASLATGWWAVYRASALLTRTDNPRRAIDDRSVRRGAILDRNNRPINSSINESGEYQRTTFYPALSNIVGYNDPTYGQSGLEAGLDAYLRGLQGSSGLSLWWNHLLYGQTPPGLDVRLSLDLDFQQAVDNALGENDGAAVLLNAESGEVLAMASHPTFDSNQLAAEWENLVKDPTSPLLNRAVQGSYELGDLLTGLFPGSVEFSELEVGVNTFLPFYEPAPPQGEIPSLSPLQVAVAAAAISNGGIRPPARLVTAVNTPQAGWIVLPISQQPRQLLSPASAAAAALRQAVAGERIWQKVESVKNPNGLSPTWYIAGTLPDWEGTPYIAVVLLEQSDAALAEQIGRKILETAMGF